MPNIIITNTEARLYTTGPIKLAPGPNEVDAEAWAIEREHPVVQLRLRAGKLVEGLRSVNDFIPDLQEGQEEAHQAALAAMQARHEEQVKEFGGNLALVSTALDDAQRSREAKDEQLAKMAEEFEAFKAAAAQQQEALAAQLAEAQAAAQAAAVATTTPGGEGAPPADTNQAKGGKGAGKADAPAS